MSLPSNPCHSPPTPCHSDTHSYRQHTITVDWLLLAELRQNMNVVPFYVFLHCAVDECYDVSEIGTAFETLQRSPAARRKIPADHKVTTKDKPYKL